MEGGTDKSLYFKNEVIKPTNPQNYGGNYDISKHKTEIQGKQIVFKNLPTTSDKTQYLFSDTSNKIYLASSNEFVVKI